MLNVTRIGLEGKFKQACVRNQESEIHCFFCWRSKIGKSRFQKRWNLNHSPQHAACCEQHPEAFGWTAAATAWHSVDTKLVLTCTALPERRPHGRSHAGVQSTSPPMAWCRRSSSRTAVIGGEWRWISSKMQSRWYETHICSYHSPKLSNAQTSGQTKISAITTTLPSQCCNGPSKHQSLRLLSNGLVKGQLHWSTSMLWSSVSCQEEITEPGNGSVDHHWPLQSIRFLYLPPPPKTNMAMENPLFCRCISHWKWWCAIAMLVFGRVGCWGSRLCNLRWVVASGLLESPAEKLCKNGTQIINVIAASFGSFQSWNKTKLTSWNWIQASIASASFLARSWS